jgi:hypothetical protein
MTDTFLGLTRKENIMEYATLGNTALLVSKLCFGTMAFGDGRGLFNGISSVGQAGADQASPGLDLNPRAPSRRITAVQSLGQGALQPFPADCFEKGLARADDPLREHQS